MFDIGWGELVLIGVVALVVIGPKELPTVLRTVGQFVAKVRRMAGEFQGQFQEALREAELADVKKEFDAATTAKDFGLDFNPIADVKREIESAVSGLPETPTSLAAPSVPIGSAPMVDAAAAGTAPITADAVEPSLSFGHRTSEGLAGRWNAAVQDSPDRLADRWSAAIQDTPAPTDAAAAGTGPVAPEPANTNEPTVSAEPAAVHEHESAAKP